jgi:prepilin-type N-terminal cleavage/methylation domain-containing protein
MTRQVGRRRDELGFTLIELLIVIIILAILAGIVVFAVGTTSANAATSACQSDAQAVTTAVEEYKAAVGVYPGDISLQNPAGSINQNPLGPTPLTTYGQSWNISGYQLPRTYGLLGDVGDPSNPAATWVAPNGATVGPFLRQLPSQTNYRIVTDGEGNVYVIPPAGPGVHGLPNQGPMLIGQTVDYFLPTTGDSNALNYAQDPAICSDPNVVK